MSMVAIDNLVPGMVLAANVMDTSGRLLLGEGSELAARHLMIFRIWGVMEADIVGVEGEESPPLPDDICPEDLESARDALIPQYCHTDLEHPAISELFRLAALRKVKHDRN